MKSRILNFLYAFALFGYALHRTAIGGDGFFYLATGDWVLSHGELPLRDPFSFNSTGPWLLHFPLCQIGFSVLVRYMGMSGLMFVCAAAATAAILALWRPYASTARIRFLTAIPLAVWIILDEELFNVRGQLWGLLPFSGLLMAMVRLREAGRVPWWVPVLLGGLWVNLHPSFMLLIALPPLFCLAHQLDPLEQRPPARPYLKFSILALASSGLNPYGFALPLDEIKLFTHAGASIITLFLSPDLHDPEWIAAFGFGFLLMAFRLRSSRNITRRNSDAALLWIFMFAALYSRRYLFLLSAWQVVVIAGLAGHSLENASPSWPRADKLLKSKFLAAGTALVMALAALRETASPRDPFQFAPVEAASIVEKLNLPDNILNSYPWGGYLNWRWRGSRKVFIDGRNTLFPDSLMEDFLRIAYTGPGWKELLDMYYIRTVIWERGTPLDLALQVTQGWTLAHIDAKSVVYTREKPIPSGLLSIQLFSRMAGLAAVFPFRVRRLPAGVQAVH